MRRTPQPRRRKKPPTPPTPQSSRPLAGAELPWVDSRYSTNFLGNWQCVPGIPSMFGKGKETVAYEAL